jgi:hypothetical protein
VIGGRVLDVSAVLDLATGTSVYGQALLHHANDAGIVLAVPAGALQAAWQQAEIPGRPWLDLLADLPTVMVIALDGVAARDCGLLAAEAGLPDAPAGTVHAVELAVRRSWPLVTTDPDTALTLSVDVRTETIP